MKLHTRNVVIQSNNTTGSTNNLTTILPVQFGWKIMTLLIVVVVTICSLQQQQRHVPTRTIFISGVYGSTPSTPSAPPRISNLSVTLRGQKYDVENVSTVQDIQEQISTLSGIAISQQGRVIYGGTKLSSDTLLTDVPGLQDGAHLNIVPSTSSTKKKKKSTATTAATAATSSSSSSSASSSTSAATATPKTPLNPMLSDLFKNSGIDTKDIDEMMKSIGGGGGEGLPKSFEESMKSMQEVMKSPMIQQMLSDPEKLEQTRQMILNNPMLANMMTSIPGMQEMIQDADTWKQSMMMAAELYKNMDSDTLMQAMMGGAQNAMMNHANAGTGSSSGADTIASTTATTSSVLDELDEDE